MRVLAFRKRLLYIVSERSADSDFNDDYSNHFNCISSNAVSSSFIVV